MPRLAWLALTAFAWLVSAATAQEFAPIPALSSRVTDTAKLLSEADRAQLEQKLAAFESSTGGQLAILIVPTALPETIEQYALRVAEAWKIGRKGQDNGAIIALAMQEKKIRIEVGRGWEGALPDVEAKRIIREAMAPFFKQGQFAQGLDAAIDKIQLAIAKENQASGSDPAWQRSHQASMGDAAWEQIMEIAPAALGVIIALAFILPAFLVGLIAGGATFFMTASVPAALMAGVLGMIFASILSGIFGSFRRAPLGGRRVYRDRTGLGGPWISTDSGGWSYGGSGGDSGWSGGGGDFGGGGASGDW